MRRVDIGPGRRGLQLHTVVAGAEHPRPEQIDDEVYPEGKRLDSVAVALVYQPDAVLAAVFRNGIERRGKVCNQDDCNGEDLNHEGTRPSGHPYPPGLGLVVVDLGEEP